MSSFKSIAEFATRNAKRLIIAVAAVLGLYALLGFVVVPRVITAVAPEKISAAVGRPFGMDAAAFNPFTFTLRISGVTLGEPEGGDFVTVGAVTANAEILPLLTLTPTLKLLEISAPSARVVRNTDGSFNFSDLLKSPDQASAAEIFSKYLVPELPLDPSLVEARGGAADAVAWMIDEVTEEMYRPAPENQLLEVAYADGSREILYFRDFASGAIIENIVSRAKLAAVKELIGSGRKGLTLEHLRAAMREEYRENEDLPRNTNPAEWYRILGMRGERVVRVRSLLAKDREGAADSDPGRAAVETVEVGDVLA